MDDPLGNDLRNRIKEVFDNYEDTSADEGWLLLREKFPEEAKRRPVAWLWWVSAAAILLLFLGIGAWLINKPAITQTNTIVKIKKEHPDSTLYTNTDQHKDNSIKTDSTSANVQTPATNATAKISGPAVDHVVIKSTARASNAAVKTNQPVNTNISQSFATLNPKNVDHQNTFITKGFDGTPNDAVNNSTRLNAFTAAKTNKHITDTSSAIVNALKAKVQPTFAPKKDLFVNDNNLKEDKSPEKTKSDDKMIRFAIYAATYFNYAKGSNNQFNAGVGFTSDIKISNNLRLSTGIAIAQNTLAYNSQLPGAAASSNSAVASANIAASAYKAQGEFIAVQPNLKTYNASLVGLDIPLNLKYSFDPQKNDTYVSAGLSSGTFINETYTYNYSYAAPFSGNNPQTQGVTTKNSFNSFYFAKTLNLALGIGYPLGKTNRLIIEPFLKYPLDGLGSQQLRFGAGGLNLKFNFKGTR